MNNLTSLKLGPYGNQKEHKVNEKKNYKLEENVCNLYDWEGISTQNIHMHKKEPKRQINMKRCSTSLKIRPCVLWPQDTTFSY